MKSILNKKKKNSTYNLTLPERSILSYLKQHQEFIILPTDKNLGPAILNRKDYIRKVLNEHLLTPAYTQLQTHLADNRIVDTKNNRLKIYNDQKHLLSKAETTFFSRNLYFMVSPRSINLPGHSGQWLAVSTAFLISSQPGSILR